MLAVVKKPHTNRALFEVKGDIPARVMAYLQREFGQDIEIREDDEEFVNIFETGWYKNVIADTTPGDMVRIYRENFGLTQAELGQKLGHFTRQKISDIEHNKRSISKNIAEKLSQIFGVPIERFL